ncbi:hypothetical protein QNH14_04810 [Apirhabdus apintestini]|uniref:hypothetical protein n=1 Tax=Erwinia sp. HR93 TaxID=3094840 RepID=UPI002ADED833|nr:hypothetical protein [Erwinia sp. HR93]MEA1064348.1 hypothetical protein [Erwinia sp. HR93]WPM85452.1 hypothetical protein QNH14_04810 [Enterobacteriaceae bacterium CA-0114]
MRNLTTNELQTVSGAGFFTDLGSKIGSTIGNIVANDYASRGVKDPDGLTVSAGTTLGRGIGEIVDNIFNPLHWGETISDMANGIQLIVQSRRNAKSQLS